jgi:hypothetical protein
MFFVGTTGQILTFLLTVCLPFAFLMSGQRVSDKLQEASNTSVYKEFTDVSESRQAVKPYFEKNLIVKNDQTHSEITSDPEISASPPVEFLFLTKYWILTSSGNKAPPLLKNLISVVFFEQTC